MFSRTGAAEQRRLLRHDADGAAQVGEREVRTSWPSSVTRPAVTSQKRGSSDAIVVLPAPERPDERHDLAGARARATSRSTSGSSGA
jgi:hypothetical protein